MTDLLADLFFPHLVEKQSEVEKKRTKFVHYTSAATGLSIIKHKKVWMRNSRVMNDFKEVEHGQQCIKHAWKDPDLETKLKTALNRIHPSLHEEIAARYDSTLLDQVEHTYLASVSEHGNDLVDEDRYGRLSMWRAYGGSTNVALILNNTPFFSESSSLKAYVSPVFYGDREKFKGIFHSIVENVEKHIEPLSEYRPEDIADRFDRALFFAALSTKHPGFFEEREWRILHSPSLIPCEHIQPEIKIVEGVPQKVYMLPIGAETKLADLIAGVIIGPTEHPQTIREAYLDLLLDEGIDDPGSIVRISDIPLRR